jgi:hypothetical protein
MQLLLNDCIGGNHAKNVNIQKWNEKESIFGHTIALVLDRFNFFLNTRRPAESFQKKCARGDSRAHSEEDMEKVTSTLKKAQKWRKFVSMSRIFLGRREKNNKRQLVEFSTGFLGSFFCCVALKRVRILLDSLSLTLWVWWRNQQSSQFNIWYLTKRENHILVWCWIWYREVEKNIRLLSCAKLCLEWIKSALKLSNWFSNKIQ